MVESCKRKAECLQSIVRELAAEPDASKFRRYCTAVRWLGKEAKVEEVVKGMLEDVHLLAGNRAIKAATEAEVAQILRAIEELSDMQPSTFTAYRSLAFSHYGSGQQFNSSDGGTQNANTGGGNQFVGATFNGFVTFGRY